MNLEMKIKRLIVCLTGMPGSGKSTVAASLKEKGFSLMTMGDIVREEAKRQDLEPTDTNLGNLMIKLRCDLGPGAVAHLVLRKMQRDIDNGINIGNVVIDGIRSIPEVEVLKTVGHVKLLAIHASTNTRFGHLKERARTDAPSIIEELITRDKRELKIGVSEAIALADDTVSNNNQTIGQLKGKAFALIQKWMDEIDEDNNE
jgi:dephospho-CoA kinase